MFESSNQRQFQKGLDADKMRMNRRDTQLSLRKKTREAHLQKRMRLLSSRSTAGSANAAGTNGQAKPSFTPKVEHIPQYVHHVMQPDSLKLQRSGMQALRILLSQQRNPPIEQVVKTGVVPKIVQFVSNPVDDGQQKESTFSEDQKLLFELQIEAAWILTNLASSTNAVTTMIVKLGATEKLVEMVRTATSDEAIDMALWGLGNIAGENQNMTQRVVSTGFLNDLISALPRMSSSVQGNATWLLSNIMRNSPQLSMAQHERLIPALAQLIRTAGAPDAITSVLWTLSSMSNSETLCMMMAQQGMVDDIVRLVRQEVQKCERTLALKKAQLQKQEAMLRSSLQRPSQLLDNKNLTIEAQKAMDHNIYKPSFRILGNIVSGPDELTQYALNAGFLDVLDPFLNHFSSVLRKETLWAISNILAGSPDQIETVLSRDKLLHSIMRAAKNESMAVRREACWCLGNATVDAVSSQIKKLADFGAIEALCRMLSPAYELTDDHTKVIVEALESFLKIYGKGGYNPYADQVEEYNGLDYLEDRQTDSKISESTYNAIVALMAKYWGTDDEFDQGVADEMALKDQLAAAVDAKTNTFKFGCSGSAENLSIIGNNGFHSKNNANNTAIYQF